MVHFSSHSALSLCECDPCSFHYLFGVSDNGVLLAHFKHLLEYFFVVWVRQEDLAPFTLNKGEEVGKDGDHGWLYVALVSENSPCKLKKDLEIWSDKDYYCI